MPKGTLANIAGARNEYSSKALVGNWVEDKYGLDLAAKRTGELGRQNVVSEHASSFKPIEPRPGNYAAKPTVSLDVLPTSLLLAHGTHLLGGDSREGQPQQQQKGRSHRGLAELIETNQAGDTAAPYYGRKKASFEPSDAAAGCGVAASLGLPQQQKQEEEGEQRLWHGRNTRFSKGLNRSIKTG